MKKVVLLFIIISQFFPVNAQDRIGLSGNPGSGTYGIFLNPAFSSRYALDWHINIFSFHQFVETNYGYITHSNLFSLLGNLNDIDIVSNRNDINENNSSRQLIFDTDGGKKSFSVNTSILWPSAIWKKSEKERLGAFIHTRGMASGFRIPEQLGYYEISEVVDSTVEIGPFSLSASSWTDLGIHYSRIMQNDQYESSAIGINARLVLPHESGKFASLNTVDYSHYQDTFSATGLVTSSGYNVFVSGSTGYSPRFNGIGLATDIGYHYKTNDYSYGVSLLDLGFAYIGGNAETYDIISDTTVVYDASEVVDPGDIIGIVEDVDDQLEAQVSRVVDEGGSFTLGMPTAFSIQYARPFSSNLAFSANLVQRIPLFSSGLRRPNSLSLAANYRSGLLTINLPATLYEYRDFRMGVSIMYWMFYIGSDNVSSLFGSRNFSGADIYLGIQYYPFDKAVTKKGVHCFDFKG